MRVRDMTGDALPHRAWRHHLCGKAIDELGEVEVLVTVLIKGLEHPVSNGRGHLRGSRDKMRARKVRSCAITMHTPC